MKKTVDLSEFASVKPIRCQVFRIRADLEKTSAERLAKLDAALEDHSITAPAITRVLDTWGHPIMPARITNHRRGECQCPTT